MAGKATIQMKADDLGIDMDGPAVMQVIDDLKRLEHEGYHFEAADASLELLMRRSAGWEHDFFGVESMRVITDEVGVRGRSTPRRPSRSGSVEERYVFTAEGNGPVNAIDTALRRAVQNAYPHLANIHLTDYKVRILEGGGGDRCGDARAAVGDRRCHGLDDDRRQPEHHRGVLAGTRGERRLRPAPRPASVDAGADARLSDA